MKMTDDILSAFLDNELTDVEMEAVRKQLIDDPGLADRLAELASVDAELQAHYGSINERPVPESITRLLGDDRIENVGVAAGNVVTFPWWRRVREHSGKAVAAAVIAGVVITQSLTPTLTGDPAWPAVANILDHQPSGAAYRVSDGATLTPRLTFRNQTGDWCRQFRLDTGEAGSERIACLNDAGDWQQVAETQTTPTPDPDAYQTASGGHELDQILDRMMAGEPVGPDTERDMIEQHWGD